MQGGWATMLGKASACLTVPHDFPGTPRGELPNKALTLPSPGVGWLRRRQASWGRRGPWVRIPEPYLASSVTYFL